MLKNLIDNLNKIISNKNISDDNDLKTLESVLNVLNNLKRNKENEETFQGDIKKPLTLKDVLNSIKVPKLNKRAYILDEKDSNDKKLLDMPVILLQDDGMGYGALNGACREAYVNDYDENNKSIYLWF